MIEIALQRKRKSAALARGAKLRKKVCAQTPRRKPCVGEWRRNAALFRRAGSPPLMKHL
jgi:hypothetical protein